MALHSEDSLGMVGTAQGEKQNSKLEQNSSQLQFLTR